MWVCFPARIAFLYGVRWPVFGWREMTHLKGWNFCILSVLGEGALFHLKAYTIISNDLLPKKHCNIKPKNHNVKMEKLL